MGEITATETPRRFVRPPKGKAAAPAEEAEGASASGFLRGVSSQRLGMRVLQEEGVFELLDEVHQADDRAPYGTDRA